MMYRNVLAEISKERIERYFRAVSNCTMAIKEAAPLISEKGSREYYRIELLLELFRDYKLDFEILTHYFDVRETKAYKVLLNEDLD